jgi:hypothetical protein
LCWPGAPRRKAEKSGLGGADIHCSPPLPPTGPSEPAAQPGASLLFVNDEDGWLMAGEHTIMATTDGGYAWHASYGGPDDPRTIEFVGPEDGWVLANDPESANGQGVLRTTNGGRSWTHLAEPRGATLVAFDFIDPRTGWSLTSVGALLATNDGGVHWSKIVAPIAGSLCITAEAALWLGTAAGNVENSVNDGSAWQVTLPWESVPKEPNMFLGPPVVPWITCSGRDASALYDWGEAAGSALYIDMTSTDGGIRWNALLGDYATGPLHSLPSVSNTPAGDGVSGEGHAWYLGYCGPCNGWGAVLDSNRRRQFCGRPRPPVRGVAQ